VLITKEKEEVKKVDEVLACVCDKCGKRIESDDHLEFQEMHHISFIGGYGSIFGDGTYVEADLCQKCLYEIIHKFMRKTEEV
jgi:hypothetical protein